MGFKLNHTIESHASVDDYPPESILVTGNSCADRISLHQGEDIISMDMNLLREFIDLINYHSVL